MRLGDLDALKKALKENACEATYYPTERVLALIDNAPTVPLPDFKDGYKQAIIDGKTNFSRQKGGAEEMTSERVIELLKEDLNHTKQHLNCVGKAPEFYDEMKEWCEALKLAIKSLERTDAEQKYESLLTQIKKLGGAE